MNAEELFRANRLAEAIDAQVQQVKANPADHARRLFLFELLAFSGDLDRARKQIDAIKYDQLELEAATAGYRRLLDAEQLRRRLFSEGLKPEFFSPPPDHVRLRLDALNRLRDKEPAEAARLIAEADAAVPPLRGKLNGKPFEGLRDCDDRFGHVIEVMAQGKYFWVPMEQLSSLAMKPPKFPRDLIWFPVRLDLHDGASGEAFLPALYPGTHEHRDDAVRLARAHDWQGGDGVPTLGFGPRLYLVGDDGIPVLEFRELTLDEPAKPE
jgi:type VI secretion system protein ImpE